jgi:O-antigen/teichoic acid export membrane protein
MNTTTALPATAQVALDRTRLLVACYLALSLLTLGAAALLHSDHAAVNDAVWVRGSIVALTSILMFAFATRAAQGSKGGLVRLRIVSAIMLVAIVVIVSLPDPFPLWLKVEQAVCGVLLLGVCVLANGRVVRGAFSER